MVIVKQYHVPMLLLVIQLFQGHPYLKLYLSILKWSGKAEDPIILGEICYMDENQLAEGKDYCGVYSRYVRTFQLFMHLKDAKD